MSTRVSAPGRSRSGRPIRVPVQARSRETVDAILGGAARVLASHGYAGATTNHISDAAGVSIGSLYQYFTDKDHVIAALATQFAQDALAFSRNHIDDGEDHAAQVRTWLEAVVTRASESEALIRVLFNEVPYTWSIDGVREAVEGALAAIERLRPLAGADAERSRDRAYVILKSTMSVIIDVAADPVMRARRESVIEELIGMIEAYLAALSASS